MLKKIGSFFEEYVEKIVLVVVGLLCVFLFIFRVLFSPNIIEVVNNEIRDREDKTVYGYIA